MSHRSFSALSLGLAMACAVAGCSGGNPARDLAVAAGVTGGEPKPAPDFVSRARRSNLDYIPVGTSAPPRRYRTKTSTEVGAAEADLERVKAGAAARGREPQ